MSSSIIVPGGTLTEKWTQQIHRGCGGEIVIIVQPVEGTIATCCKGCRDIWILPIAGWPDTWESPKRKPERLILPPSVGGVH